MVCTDPFPNVCVPSNMARLLSRSAPDIVVEYVKPVVDTKDKPKQIREKDLEGHIEGEKGEGDGIDEKTGREMADLKKDNQLKSAIDLLRTWEVFKKM